MHPTKYTTTNMDLHVDCQEKTVTVEPQSLEPTYLLRENSEVTTLPLSINNLNNIINLNSPTITSNHNTKNDLTKSDEIPNDLSNIHLLKQEQQNCYTANKKEHVALDKSPKDLDKNLRRSNQIPCK